MYPYATAVTICGAAVFGVVLALLGSVKLALARQLDLGGRRLAGLLATLNLAFIPMTVLAGLLTDWWRPRLVLLLGSVGTSVGLYVMSRAPTYRRAVWATLLMGLGAAFVSTATIKLMVVAFAPVQGARGLSLGYVFIALGALLTPAVADVLVHRLDFRRAVAFLALLCLIPGLLCALPVLGDQVSKLFPDSDAPTRVTLFDADLFSKLVLAGVVFFFYAPLEAAISVWATTYLTQLGYGERKAAWLLCGFWAALLGSRFLLAVIPFQPVWYPWLIIVPALLTVVALGNMAGSAETSAPRIGLLLLGFLLGPIFPTLLGVVHNCFPKELGSAYGLVFAAGSLGGLMLAPFVAPRATPKGDATFRAPIVLALVLTVAALVFGLIVGHGSPH
jgi:fucose permease